MDLFYSSRYDSYDDEFDEQDIIDDALDAINAYKLKQAAGVPDITIYDFVDEIGSQLQQNDEHRIRSTELLSTDNIAQKITELNRRLKTIQTPEAEYELGILETALERKAMSNQERVNLQKELKQIDKKIADNKLKIKQEQELIANYRIEQQKLIDQNQQRYNAIYNSSAPGGNANDTRNRQLIQLIDERLSLIKDKEGKETDYIQNQLKLNELNDDHGSNIRDTMIKIHKIEFELYHLIDSPFLVNDRIKSIIHRFLESEDQFQKFLANRDLIRCTINNLSRHHVVTNGDFNYCNLIEKQYPGIFISWEKLLSNQRQVDNFIRRIRLNHQSVFNEYKSIENSYNSNRDISRDNRIVVLPSIHMISEFAIRNNNRIYFIEDGIRHQWFDYNRFYDTHYARSNIINKYEIFSIYRIFISMNQPHQRIFSYQV